jgi:hypothetical protein
MVTVAGYAIGEVLGVAPRPLIFAFHISHPSRTSRPPPSCHLAGKALTHRSTLTREMATPRAARLLGNALPLRSLGGSKRLDLAHHAERTFRRRLGAASASCINSWPLGPPMDTDVSASLARKCSRVLGWFEPRTDTSTEPAGGDEPTPHQKSQWKQFPLASCVEVDDDGG